MSSIVTTTTIPVADPSRRMSMGLCAFTEDRIMLSLEAGADLRAIMHVTAREAAAWAYAILDALEQCDKHSHSQVA